MRIYIAHPYTGDEEKNRERALKAEGLLRKATPQTAFYNPVGRMSDSKQIEETMSRHMRSIDTYRKAVLAS